jgi:hypothetical protein
MAFWRLSIGREMSSFRGYDTDYAGRAICLCHARRAAFVTRVRRRAGQRSSWMGTYFSHDEVFPIISRVITARYGETGEYVRHAEIAEWSSPDFVDT